MGRLALTSCSTRLRARKAAHQVLWCYRDLATEATGHRRRLNRCSSLRNPFDSDGRHGSWRQRRCGRDRRARAIRGRCGAVGGRRGYLRRRPDAGQREGLDNGHLRTRLKAAIHSRRCRCANCVTANHRDFVRHVGEPQVDCLGEVAQHTIEVSIETLANADERGTVAVHHDGAHLHADERAELAGQAYIELGLARTVFDDDARVLEVLERLARRLRVNHREQGGSRDGRPPAS